MGYQPSVQNHCKQNRNQLYSGCYSVELQWYSGWYLPAVISPSVGVPPSIAPPSPVIIRVAVIRRVFSVPRVHVRRLSCRPPSYYLLLYRTPFLPLQNPRRPLLEIFYLFYSLEIQTPLRCLQWAFVSLEIALDLVVLEGLVVLEILRQILD